MATPAQSAQALAYLFKQQDEALSDNLAADPLMREVFELLSDACYLSIDILRKMPFDGDKFDVLSTFAIDSISATVIATRVALWGNPPEAMSILRCAIERSAQLMYIVGEGKYRTAGYEINDGSFKRVSFESAVNAMGDLGKRIEKLHGLISGGMAHATVIRLGWSLYDRDGTQHARVGSSNDFKGALACLSHAADVLIVVLDRLSTAYAEDHIVFEFASSVTALNDRYLAFKPKCEQLLAAVTGE
jgi:hypothetical protein